MIQFDLTPKQYVCLLEKVLAGSPSLASLKKAKPGVRADASVTYTVNCEETNAHAFLQVAKKHCPDAVPAIEEALRRRDA